MSRVFGRCNTCGGQITRRQNDERHADEVWCATCGIRFSLSNPGLAARTVDGSKTWSWTPLTDEEKQEMNWVNHMADREDEHGGFPGFSGRLGRSPKGADVLAAELAAIKDIAFKMRQRISGVVMSTAPGSPDLTGPLRDFLTELDRSVKLKENEMAASRDKKTT